MKKLVLFLLIIMPAAGFTQNVEIDNFFKKYSGKDGFTTIIFTKEMFDLYKSGSSAQGTESSHATEGIYSMKMLTAPSDSTTHYSFTEELNSVLPKNKFKQLMLIQEGNNTINFVVRQEGNRIKEFIMTIDGDSPLLIYIEGDMDINQLSELSKSMDIRGLDELENDNTEE